MGEKYDREFCVRTVGGYKFRGIPAGEKQNGGNSLPGIVLVIKGLAGDRGGK